MAYKIIDQQIEGREFADGAIFDDKEEVREQLIDFHSIDCDDVEQLEKMGINQVLEYGQWALQQVCDVCGQPEDDDGRCGCTNEDAL